MPLQTDGKGPYAPPKAIIDVITAYRERGLQTPFTTDVLIKAGVSETLAPRTLLSLKLLDLISEDGEPTQEFEALRKAASNELSERFAELLRSVYAEVFSYIDPKQDSPERIRDAFRSYVPTGQQERMVTLFLGLCGFAGIIEESAAKRRPGPRTGSTRRPPQRRSAATKPKAPSTPREPEPPSEPSALGGLKPPAHAAGGHPIIQGLLRELPPIGAAWPAEKRKAWLDLQAAAFNVLYKLAPEDDEGGEQP